MSFNHVERVAVELQLSVKTRGLGCSVQRGGLVNSIEGLACRERGGHRQRVLISRNRHVGRNTAQFR